MENKPTPFPLKTDQWWVKPLAMLQHNWAVIDDSSIPTTVYFFHDRGTTKLPSGYVFRSKDAEKFIAIVDSLNFESHSKAEEALRINSFSKIEDESHPFAAYKPEGTVFDARSTEKGIYSKEGYWQNE
jgi:hypothetical protein